MYMSNLSLPVTDTREYGKHPKRVRLLVVALFAADVIAAVESSSQVRESIVSSQDRLACYLLVLIPSSTSR